jgi:ketosteroid isomerase-like protein
MAFTGIQTLILARLAPDVQWEYGPVSQNVPWYQNRHGVEGATAFFQSLAGCEFHQFDTTAFIAEGDTVVVLVNSDYTVKKTGKRVVYEDAVFLVKCNADGQIYKFAHRVDLHQAWLAYNGENAA